MRSSVVDEKAVKLEKQHIGYEFEYKGFGLEGVDQFF